MNAFRKSRENIVVGSMIAGVAICMVAPAANAEGEGSVEVNKLVPELAVSQTPAESKFAQDADIVQLSKISPETVRLLGEDDRASYWVGRSGSSELCLITTLNDDSDVAAASCTELPTFDSEGLALRVGSSGPKEDDPEAYLLPSDVTELPGQGPGRLRSTGSEPIGESQRGGDSSDSSGLYVLPAGEADQLEPENLSRADGRDFTFQPIGDDS